MVEDKGSVTGPMALEDYELPDGAPDSVEPSVDGAIRYAFVGSGQGGSRIAAAAYARGYAKTIVINTAPQDLEHIRVPEEHKLLLDIGAGGAGKNIVRGEEAVKEHQGEVYDLMQRVFGRHVDHVMICIGAGGGSGGGSVIPLVMLAKKYLQALGHVDVDKRVGVIMALPRTGEVQSRTVAFNASTVADRVSELADEGTLTPLVLIDNAKIQDLHPRLTPANLWPTVNDGVLHLFDLFNRLPLLSTPHSSFDPADYETVIRAGGHLVMGVTKIKAEDVDALANGGETVISKVMRTSIDRTLIADGFDLTRSRAAAGIIVASADTLGKIPDAVTEYVYSMLGSLTGGAAVHRGMYEDDRHDLRVYTIVGGLPAPEKRYERLRSQAKDPYPRS